MFSPLPESVSLEKLGEAHFPDTPCRDSTLRPNTRLRGQQLIASLATQTDNDHSPDAGGGRQLLYGPLTKAFVRDRWKVLPRGTPRTTPLLSAFHGRHSSGFNSLWPAVKLYAHRTLSTQASFFERPVSGDTRFCCSAQCAGSLTLGSSVLFLPPGLRITRRVD